ncbi:Bug family tripartite tricarboxylate transporter substrate binding protein [Comamonas aquatica]|uniref:Bug family tripartite tricarboxylate transporter substrate binding protein n=1 Tax=Comamonas aquatica TaxID=225991 RepID=UPI001B3660FF|nr:tripartite tricarboxylate transporter substrate binding protein [Comamonas aquatica]MDH0201527.1 tripartite tricarboxylate transporter substrate binding protein [Comamonas aquatica]MDH1380169.1 tripartite tricarboxylate transporter substrate binding protein [Comamonas aquatica]MDH1446497.1 tripartite tricarboxylate transporter substrate binding protein [Comamonas aquatica]MDH1640692.1 tripartite tricarboxylate transporter substrate binding protein [Comamonas aquatica]MDH1813752.1 tripartite
MLLRPHLLACTLAALCVGTSATAADTYPSKPVKVMVALPAGGSADMLARVISQELGTKLGQSFVVENKAGGSGQIGMPQVARATPDGYTLTVSPASFLTTNKSIFKQLAYDPQTDFQPIARLVNQPMVLVVKDKARFPSVAAVVTQARAAPGQLTYASSGDGSPQHLGALMFSTRTQSEMLHVPYKGGANAINDTLAGNVDMLFAVLPEALPHIQSGKLQALGVMSPQRSPLLPQVATMAESGFADLQLSAWVGLLAPAKTPPAVVAQLNQAVRSVLQGPARDKLLASGMEPAPSSPEELQATIAGDLKLHAELVKAAGLQPQ